MPNQRIEFITAKMKLIKFKDPLAISVMRLGTTSLNELLANNTLSNEHKENLIDLVAIATLVTSLALNSKAAYGLYLSGVPDASKEDENVSYFPSLQARFENDVWARVILRGGKKILNGEFALEFEAAQNYNPFSPFKELFARVGTHRKEHNVFKENQKQENVKNNDIGVGSASSPVNERDPGENYLKSLFEYHTPSSVVSKPQQAYLAAITELKEDILAQYQTNSRTFTEVEKLGNQISCLTLKVMAGTVSQADINLFLKTAEPFQASKTALIIKNILGILTCMVAGFAVAGIPGAAVGTVAGISAGLAFTLWTKSSNPISKVECAATPLLLSSNCA